MSELKIKTVSGIKWLVGSSFLQKAISVATTVVLARILDPYIFGLCALAFIVIDAFGIFKSMGFDSALIQRKDNVEKAANTAFFVIPLLGVFLYLIIYFSASTIGRFLNNLEVVNVIRILGFIFLISCFSKVPAALMEKNIEFKKIATIEIIGRIIFSIIAILFAILGFGVWSLALAFIIKTFMENTFFWVFAKWRPSFTFDKKIFWEMFHFGKFLSLSGIVWFLKMTLDNLLVGKILGVTALGLYAIAFNIANFGADYFAGKVNRVIFPVFSKIQSDRYDLKQAFLKTTKVMGIFAFPFCCCIFLLGSDLIRIVYGVKWIEAAPVLKILAFAGLLNTLPVAIGPLFYSTGHPRAGFWFVSIQVSLFFLFISPAAKLYGLVGVGFVVVFSQLIAIIIYLPFIMRLASLRVKDLYLSLKPGLFSSLFLSFIIVIYKLTILRSANNINLMFYVNITLLMIIAIPFYIFSLWFIDRAGLKELKRSFISEQ